VAKILDHIGDKCAATIPPVIPPGILPNNKHNTAIPFSCVENAKVSVKKVMATVAKLLTPASINATEI
jgi:hypothetical protein